MGRRIALAVLIFPAVYLLGAFIAWDFNAGNWDTFGRGMLAFIATWTAIGILIFP